MATTIRKMICPRCGAEMNHHGNKLVYDSDPQGTRQIDAALGGLVDEFHTCPKCGATAARAA
jgi:ribosomal protein S27AE